MSLFLSPVCNDQTFDANGDPLTGGQIETYLAGSSTPAATYTDDSGGTPQSNPIILNSLGYPTLGDIWLTGGISYKFIIKNAAGSTLRTIDDISGINDASVSQSEWVESGFVPTFIDATNFSVPGDQTAVLQVNRRTRTTNTSGFIYSTITNSVFAAGITTVTLVNDSGALDVGLSAVAYGLLSADDSAIPIIQIEGGGTGQTTALTAFDALKQSATDAYAGVVEKLTTAEAQTGTDDTRYMSAATMKAAQIQLGTAVVLTNQTLVDFTGIPAWAKRITILFSGVSSSATSAWQIQIGDAGGIENTGYSGAALLAVDAGATQGAQMASGFRILTTSAAAGVNSGVITLHLFGGNTWVEEGGLSRGDASQHCSSAGSKTLSDVLTQLRLTTINGTDQFDAGTVNISYE